ncbi:hypothetical protein UI24_17050 [Mycobacteroides franklinii]|nr:hypothetical protein [Mycobacteroides franklinii]
MSDLVDRAKTSLSDHQWAKACRVESLYPERLMSQLITEVERLEAERDQALWTLDKVTESWKRLVAGASDD